VSEMSRTFNCGVGFALMTACQHASSVLAQLTAAGETGAAVIGSVVSLNAGVYRHPTTSCSSYTSACSLGEDYSVILEFRGPIFNTS